MQTELFPADLNHGNEDQIEVEPNPEQVTEPILKLNLNSPQIP